MLHPDKKIFKYLFFGLDIILGKPIASANLIPLLRICCAPAFNPNDTQNTERPWIVPVSGVCFATWQTMHSIRFARNDYELNRIDFRFNIFDGKGDRVAKDGGRQRMNPMSKHSRYYDMAVGSW